MQKDFFVIKNIVCVFLIFILQIYSPAGNAFENTFYSLRSDISESLKQHHKMINTIITQAYYTNNHGEITGNINTNTLELAKQYNIKVIAQVTNYQFDGTLLHAFLSSDPLQDNAIQGLIKKCQDNHLAGIQIDFEHLNINDKELFTRFIEKLAVALHQAHFILSVAVIPNVSPNTSTTYLMRRYQGWSGGFDLHALGKISDFISLMAYDQHIGASTPGPVAGYTWVKFVISHALKSIPREKLLLGIPTYSSYWKMHETHLGDEQISYEHVSKLMKRYHFLLTWNTKDKVHFAVFDPDYIYRYLFVEDAQSIKYKLNLAKQYHLRGISVFRLGVEDPKIWDYLNK